MISIEGMKKLFKMKEKGEELPEGWEKEVTEYMRMKKKIIEKEIKEYKLAKAICEFLGVENA